MAKEETTNPITEAMKLVVKVRRTPGQTEEQFLEAHHKLVGKDYTIADELAAKLVLRALSDGSSGTASIKELMDRTEGPVIRKPEEKKTQAYVIAVPLPAIEDEGLSQRERWEKILESQGIKKDPKREQK